jgi:hypothetical protein
MSSRYNGLIVTFDEELNEEWVEELKSAFMKFKNVISVELVHDNFESHMAREQALNKLRDQMREILWPRLKK